MRNHEDDRNNYSQREMTTPNERQIYEREPRDPNQHIPLRGHRGRGRGTYAN